jgi:4-hydroxy-3-polyprenylbenzoate decarboxylase
LLEQIDCAAHEVHLVMSTPARQVAKQELDDFTIPPNVLQHSENDMNVPFVSGSARFDAMVIVPCSMATLGRIASGSSDSALLRAADVFLKERRKLILVPRETPWSLIHARNVVTLLEAGAIVLPAIPSFYSRPGSLTAVVDTVVWRILDQIGLPSPRAYRWGRQSTSTKSSRKKS